MAHEHVVDAGAKLCMTLGTGGILALVGFWLLSDADTVSTLTNTVLLPFSSFIWVSSAFAMEDQR